MNEKIAVVLATLIISVACVLMLVLYIPYATILWDEAFFLKQGYTIHLLFSRHRWNDLWSYTLTQFFYPPFPAYLMAALQFLQPFDMYAARITGLIWFIAVCWIMYFMARIITAKNLFACVASVAILCSSPLILYHASIQLREIIGAVFTMLTTYAYGRILEGKRSWIVPTILLFVAVFFVKYQYLVIFAVGIPILFLLSWFQAGNHKKRTTLFFDHLILGLGTASIISLWIFLPTNRLGELIAILKNENNYTGGMVSWDQYLLFFPKTILYYYSAHPFLGVALIAGFLASVLIWKKNAMIRTCGVLFIVNLVLATIHTRNIQARYIMTTFPLFCLASVAGWKFAIDQINQSRYRKAGMIVIACIAIGISPFILASMLRLPRSVYSVGTVSIKSLGFPMQDYQDHWFTFDPSRWPKIPPQQTKEHPRDVLSWIFTHVDAKKPQWWLTHSGEFSPPYVTLYAELQKRTQPPIAPSYPGYIITIYHHEDSILYHRDFRLNGERMNRIIIDPSFQQFLSQLTLVATKTFSHLGVTVKIYARTDPGYIPPPEDPFLSI